MAADPVDLPAADGSGHHQTSGLHLTDRGDQRLAEGRCVPVELGHPLLQTE
jgi:hypothetical protein